MQKLKDKPKVQTLTTKTSQQGQAPKIVKKIENIRGSVSKGGKTGKGKQTTTPPWKELQKEKEVQQEKEVKEERKALVFATPASASRAKVIQQAGQTSYRYCGAHCSKKEKECVGGCRFGEGHKGSCLCSRHIGQLQEQGKKDKSQEEDDVKLIETHEEKPVTKEKRAVDLQPSRIGRSQSQMFLRGRSAVEKLAKLKESRKQKNKDSTGGVPNESVLPTSRRSEPRRWLRSRSVSPERRRQEKPRLTLREKEELARPWRQVSKGKKDDEKKRKDQSRQKQKRNKRLEKKERRVHQPRNRRLEKRKRRLSRKNQSHRRQKLKSKDESQTMPFNCIGWADKEKEKIRCWKHGRHEGDSVCKDCLDKYVPEQSKKYEKERSDEQGKYLMDSEEEERLVPKINMLRSFSEDPWCDEDDEEGVLKRKRGIAKICNPPMICVCG